MIASQLRNSTADWKIVIGHHPVYANGKHGYTQQLFDDLDPMMRNHGVQAYLCGHDHSKHYMKYEGLHYVVNGAGGGEPRGRARGYPKDSMVMEERNPGFANLEMCSEDGELKFFDEDGNQQQRATISMAAPKSGLSGSVKLESGETLNFGRSLSTSRAHPAHQMCGEHRMQQVDLFCKSEEGSGCRVLVDQPTKWTCQQYCEDNGLNCKNGWESEREGCVPTKEIGCQTGSGQTGSGTMISKICECIS